MFYATEIYPYRLTVLVEISRETEFAVKHVYVVLYTVCLAVLYLSHSKNSNVM